VRIVARRDHRLHEREQSLTRAVDRQHHAPGVDRDLETPREPGRAGRARFRQAGGRRVSVELPELATQRIDDERRRRVFGLSDRHRDMRQAGRRRDAGLQPRQSFERVGGE
jgi:hypothetical protein